MVMWANPNPAPFTLCGERVGGGCIEGEGRVPAGRKDIKGYLLVLFPKEKDILQFQAKENGACRFQQWKGMFFSSIHNRWTMICWTNGVILEWLLMLLGLKTILWIWNKRNVIKEKRKQMKIKFQLFWKMYLCLQFPELTRVALLSIHQHISFLMCCSVTFGFSIRFCSSILKEDHWWMLPSKSREWRCNVCWKETKNVNTK